MAPRPNLYPALVFAAVGAGLFLGAGTALPLWNVPYQPAVSWHAPPLDWEGCDIRSGTLWEAVAGTVTLMHTYHQSWQFENLVVGIVLLTTGALAGLLCYWAARARLRLAVQAAPESTESPSPSC